MTSGAISMINIQKYLILVFVFLLPTGGNAAADEEHRHTLVESMKLGSRWAIEEEVQVYSENGKNGVFRKLLDDSGVQLWFEPWVEYDGYCKIQVKAAIRAHII
jgi:hypothetical protein